VHGEGGGVHHADNAVSQRKHALRMKKILADNLAQRTGARTGGDIRLRCSAPQGLRSSRCSVEIDLPSSRWTKPLRANSGAQGKKGRAMRDPQVMPARPWPIVTTLRKIEALSRSSVSFAVTHDAPWLPASVHHRPEAITQARCKAASNDQLIRHTCPLILGSAKKAAELSTQTA